MLPLPLKLIVLNLLAVSAFAQQPTDYAKVSADCAPTLKQLEVPRDERRQQILVGIHETRLDYQLARKVPETDLFAECYSDGHLTHRLQLTSAMNMDKPEETRGTFSLGWNYLTHELTFINDNGFGLWNSRLTIAPEIMEHPQVIVGAEIPQPELRDTINDYPAKQVTIYPIIGIVGDSDDFLRRRSHFKLEDAADFLQQVAGYHSKQCVIIYLFGGSGGNPPFKFDGKANFYVGSLPMN